MKNENVIVVSRDLKPQWLKGGLNLGAFTPETVCFSGKGLVEFMAKSAVHADAIADMVAGASHIRFGSKLGQALASEGLPEKKDGEKHEAWMERVYDAAKAFAKERIPGARLDYCAALEDWVVEDFAKRGVAADKRPVLEDYHKIVAMVERGWTDASVPDAKKSGLLNKLGLKAELLKADAAEVVKAIAAKYRAEAVKVEEADLF